ncbi:hypothetical protein [Geminocystis sp. NIES-3709]|uniref:hypothetical protein n=1 Tax=Geminocystis sp. NIES-3709 TaxID=1617448 RepID=UPI000826E9BA|nr:hypothetical protein [Geminocystis sp. NIES-3709]
MDWLKPIEIIVIAVVPLYLWWLQRRSENSNHILLLEKKMDACEVAIDNIEQLLKHRSEVAQLKYSILKDKIEDLEEFSNRKHGYVIRKNRHTDRTAFTTMTTDDDEVDTQIF